MKKKFLFSLCLGVFLAVAVPHASADEPVAFFVSDQILTVYEKEDAESRVITELPIRSEVSVNSYANNNWYAASFPVGSIRVTGFVLNTSGKFLVNKCIRYGDVLIVLGEGKDSDRGMQAVTLKTVRNGKTIASHILKAQKESWPPELYIISGAGLQNVDFIVGASFAGHPDLSLPFSYYFAWTDSGLVPLVTVIGATAWGADRVNYGESVFFPSQGAPYNTFVKVVIASDRAFAEYSTVVYRWTGKEAIPQEQNPEILNWNKRWLE